MKEWMLKALAAVSVAGMVAVTPASAQSTQKSDADVVRVGVVKVTLHAPIFVAEKLGYYKDEGLKVEIKTVRSGPEGQSAIIGGALDFIGVNSVSFILSRHEGFPFVAVMDGARGQSKPPSSIALLVRNDGSVNTPKDLEGKSSGIITRKNLNELYFNEWAKKQGVDLSKVRLIEMGYAQMIDSLLSKQVDSVQPLEPFITRALETGKIKAMSYYDVEVEPDHASALWVGHEKWIAEHPIALRKFVSAVQRAITYLNEHPKERVQLMAEWTGLPEAIVAKMAPDNFVHTLPVESLERQVKLMRANGWLQHDVDIKKGLWTGK